MKMAKARKLSAGWSERLLGSYSYGNSNSHDRIAGGESEYGEDDVWSTVDDVANEDRPGIYGDSGEWNPRAGPENGGSFNGFRSRRGRVPRAEHHRRQVGGSSLTSDDSGEMTPFRVFRGQHDGGVIVPTNERYLATSSVPVHIPDWSKIDRVNSVESFHDYDHDSEMVPPHEYLAREYARTAANSMVEGVGRTLKGRDLSRVRDAVWSQTGFDG